MSNHSIAQIGTDVCPRCHHRIGRLDSSAVVVTQEGGREEIHAGCIGDTDEVVEYIGHSDKLATARAGWSWEDGEAA